MAEENPKEENPVYIPRGAASKSYQAVTAALDFKNPKETTVWNSSDNLDSQYAPFNPDDLYQRDGDYSTYDLMLDDDQIDVALQLKKDLVLGSGFDFTAGDEGQEEIIKDLHKSFTDECQCPFEDKLEEVLTAYEFGFSMSEKLFRKREDGTIAFFDLKTRHPNTWLFYQDIHGNIDRMVQRGGSSSSDIEIKNHDSMLHYINRPRFQNVYGRSDLRSCFAAWTIKKEIVKFKAIFLEKAASPTPVGRYETNTPATAVDAVFDALKKLQTRSALMVPESVKLEFLEAKNDGEVFIKAINLFNMFISRALFIPDLLGFSGSETAGGSFALGKEHMGLFFRHINRRRRTLETMVNRNLIRPIILYNFGEIENPPQFKFKPISDQDALALADIWLKAVNGRVYKASDEEVNHFRSLVKFPEGDVDREETPAPGDGFNPINDAKSPPADVDDSDDPAGDAGQEDIEERIADDVNRMGQFPKKKGKKKKTNAIYDFPKGSYHKKVDFKAIESQLESATHTTLDKALPVIQAIIQDLAEQIERKKILLKQDAALIDTLKLKKLADLKRIIKNDLRETFKNGQASGQKELLKGNFALPLPDDKFLEFLDAETFQYIGDWDYKIRQQAAILLRQAIKDGTPLSAVIEQLNEELTDLGETSIERYSRTKTTEVFNRGRLKFFEDSGIVAAYQYSAIMDDRTSDVCFGLDGNIFAAGTQPVPPMHFNCRSLLIPITKFEEFEVDTEIDGVPIGKFIEDNKGKGFSTFQKRNDLTTAIVACEFDGSPGFKWGHDGKCFLYDPNDAASLKRAKERAIRQGVDGIEIDMKDEETHG